MNEAAVNNLEVINNLNKVEGFDPAAFLRRLTGENGEEQFYLDYAMEDGSTLRVFQNRKTINIIEILE